MTDLHTPAAEKAGLDPKGLAFLLDRLQWTDATAREREAHAVITALQAYADAQYRRGAEDMKEAAAHASMDVLGCGSLHCVPTAIRALPIPTPDEGERS